VGRGRYPELLRPLGDRKSPPDPALEHVEIALVVHGELAADPAGLLEGLHVLKLDDPKDLDQLRDELCERLGVKPHPTPRWNERRDRFLRELPKALKKIPASGTVSREHFEAAQKEAKAARAAVEEAEAELERQKSINADLATLKDAKQVARVVAASSGEEETFNRWKWRGRRSTTFRISFAKRSTTVVAAKSSGQRKTSGMLSS
jgi:hypothetical protein